MLLCYTPALAGARRIRQTRHGRTMEVKLIEDRLLWNRFIAETATGHLCQTYEWPDQSGEADLEAFYQLLTETGARDAFFVYPKELFRDMLANYSAAHAARDGTAEMALLLAEHEGVPVAAATVAVLGAWSWNLHSGSSGRPEHRKLRPNYLLQWECMRWAKAHGADYYDWRTIPDVLQPGEELYGVYEFKRGFGGVERRVLLTQDLVLRPALYWPYTLAGTLRPPLHNRQRPPFDRGREREREGRESRPAR